MDIDIYLHSSNPEIVMAVRYGTCCELYSIWRFHVNIEMVIKWNIYIYIYIYIHTHTHTHTQQQQQQQQAPYILKNGVCFC